MIARDGASSLDSCLTSICGLVEDIVVVDTGSTDDTRVVAERHGARVYDEAWTGNFSAHRNSSIGHARGDWVLVLDCDEVLSQQDHAAIRETIANGQGNAFRLTTRNYTSQMDYSGWTACKGDFPEEKGQLGWYPTTKVRLWKKHPKVRFEGAVHELVEPSLKRLGFTIADCSTAVHHYGYVDRTRNPAEYVDAGEEKLRNDPSDQRARYELAISYRDAGRFEDARVCIVEVVEAVQKESTDHYEYLSEELVHLVHADILDRLELEDEALRKYEWIVKIFPQSYQAYNNMATLVSRRGDKKRAVDCYQRALELEPENRTIASNLERMQGVSINQANQTSNCRHRLSVCMIVKDGGSDLRRCLGSVAPIADELIVVDTGSSDDSVPLAKSFGAQTSFFEWIEDFSAARNASLEKATGDWILWMDADDYLNAEDQQKVSQAVNLVPDRGLYFTLANEGGYDTTAFQQVKMFPNHPEIRFERTVHETVVPSLQRLGMNIVVTDGIVRHTGYSSRDIVARKRTYYLELMNKWLDANPDDHDICFRVGHTHYSCGERESALQYFGSIMSAGQDAVKPLSVFQKAATFRGRTYLELGEYSKAEKDLRAALVCDVDNVLALLSLGDALTKQKKFEEAIGYLERAKHGKVDKTFPIERELVAYSIRFFLGQCCQELGRYSEARESFSEACQIMPSRSEAREALLQTQSSVSAVETGAGGSSFRDVELEEGYDPTLALCMIVKNEEDCLWKCLDSVEGLFDEIIIVDTGSDDGTVAVAQRYGAKIGYFEWCDDFSAARNAAIDLVDADWIIWLDADDLLLKEHHEEIRQLIRSGPDKSYFFVLDDQGYENVSCLQMRLFPNLQGVVFDMPVHEQVTPSLAKLGVRMIPTEIRVVHTGYTTPEIVEEKKERYLGIMEKWLVEHSQNYIVRSHVALTYYSTGRLQEAVDSYKMIVEESTCLSDHNYVVYTTALLFLGRSYMKMAKLDEAQHYIQKAYEFDSDYVLTKLSLAELFAEFKDWEKVLKFARQIREGGEQVTFFPVDQQEIKYASRFLVGRAFQHLGRIDEAVDAFEEASTIPVNRRSDALGSLSELYKNIGRRQEAVAALDRALEIAPNSPKHVFNKAMIFMEDSDLERAVALFEDVLQIFPEHGPSLLNLGFATRKRGQLDEAESYYRRAILVEPDRVDARANLAHMYLELGRHLEAIEQFRAVRVKDKSLLDINLGLLTALTKLGQWQCDAAESVLMPFKKAVSPNVAQAIIAEESSADKRAHAVVDLAKVLLDNDLGRCAEFALQIAINLIEGTSQSNDGLDSKLVVNAVDPRRFLGHLYFSRGELWKAIAQFEAILRVDPRDGEAFRQLGDCYAKLGVEDAASICYTRSRNAAGNFS